jgi:uncharacterized delta-60 repeat protein
MATQQQTVLRVQTNIPDNTIVIQSGYTAVITGDTFGISYSGTGTANDPYIGTTSGISEFTFSINDRNGILYFEYSGSGANILYVNNVVQRNDSNTTVSGTINVNDTDIVRLYFGNTGSKIINLYFVETEEVVYKYELLDLYSDIPIKINKSFAELQDIGKRNSDYSIGLQIPGSKKNNRFFESFFNVDVDTLYFNPLARVPCNVLVNDESYFNGYLKLNKISVLNSKIEYDITLFSSVGDLFGKIGNNLLKDLNFTDTQYGINHEFQPYEVQNWDSNPYSIDNPPGYFYPIVHNGYEYSGDTVNLSGGTVAQQTRLYTSTIVSGYTSYAAAYAAGVKRYRLNSPQDGLLDNQLKPALNIKNLIELMFKTYGYTIDSDFFNTPWFKMLYMYGYFSSDATKFSYKSPVPQTLALGGVNVIFVETYVDSSSFPCGTQYIKTDRTYTIYVVKAGTGTPCLCADEINLNLVFQFYPCYGGPSIDEIVPITIAPNTTGTTYSWVSNEYVDCGSGCPFSLEYRQNFVELTTGNVSISPAALSYLPTIPNTTTLFVDGDYVDFGLVIDPLIKQIDFLSSIAKKFNLVFIPNPDRPTEIKIEPYSYYIGTGNVYDWTNKLSYDKGFTVEPAQNYVESELILTDLEDGDFGNKTFKDQNNRIYGQNFVYNQTDFKSQTKKIETIFSPELLRQWDTPDTAPNGEIKLPLGINYAASSSSQSSGGTEKVSWQYKGVKTKPKLFYNLGYFNPFLDTLGEVFTSVGSILTNKVYIAASDGTGPLGREVIPIISHSMPIGNDDANKINNDSISVLFNSEQPVDIGVTPFDVFTENDSYNLFYSNRVNNLYNKNTRFLGGYFDIKLSDIENLNPNDIIKIKDQYFTWNKIDAFNLTNPELTKVELIQFNNQVNTYPTRYFQYYYCDNTNVIFKFKTDMTNPSLSGTSYGWSIFYDYSIGVLNNAGVTPLTGFTSCVRDAAQQFGYGYVPYTIYEVTEADYNATGITRNYDTLWLELSDNYNNVSTKGDLNQFNFPTYVYGSTLETYNLFEDCAQFNAAATAYDIDLGSSTFYGPPVTPTPTPTATPAPTPTPTPAMRGSLIMSFDELVPDRGIDNYTVTVNGQDRDVHFTEIDNLYSTNLNPGDVVVITLITDSTITKTLDVYRRDYTTDDQGNDMGIRDTYITGSTSNTGTTISVTFTATTIAQDYNFEYRVTAITTGIAPTPTPTAVPTNGTNGSVNHHISLYPNNKILIFGNFTQLDGSFNTDGIAKFNTDGTLDTSVDSNSNIGLQIPGGGVLHTNETMTTGLGTISLGGGNFAYNGTRRETDGTFNVSTNITYAVTGLTNSRMIIYPASNNKFYISGQGLYSGTTTPSNLVRINAGSTYTIDTGFNAYPLEDLVAYFPVYEQTDGKILIGGVYSGQTGIPAGYSSITRYNSNGSLDTSFSGNPICRVFTADIKQHTNGNIYYVGYSFGILDQYGTPIVGDVPFASRVDNLDIQSDGKAILGGIYSFGPSFTPVNGICRVNTNGTLDTTFNAGGSGFVGASIYDVKVQPDDKIIVGGSFSTYNGFTYNNIIRLNADGSIDTSF